MTTASDRRSFSSTADGVVEASRNRLGRVFGALGLLLVMGTVFAFATGQLFAGALALVLAFGVFVIHRMSRELDPTEIVVEPGSVSIFMRHALRRLPLEDSTVRRLTPDEIEHLAGLASTGGFVAGAGGFDSHILGEFDLYASRLENAVLLETTDGRVIVTPDRADDFVSSVAAVVDSAS